MYLPFFEGAVQSATRAVLTAFTRRNALVDSLFYDINRIPVSDRVNLTLSDTPEGSILIVPPSRSDDPILTLTTVDDFLNVHGPAIDTVVLTGTAGSALGTAAFARDVADALGRPVAGIVPGYGLADLMAECFGGCVSLWARGDLRRAAHAAVDAVAPHLQSQATGWSGPGKIDRERADVPGNPDATVLLSILSSNRARVRLVVTHGRGSQAAAEASAALDSVPPDLRFVTLGAAAQFPAHVHNLCQFVGSIDGLGWLNSPSDNGRIVVHPAAHHTNPVLPLSLPVAEALQRALDSDGCAESDDHLMLVNVPSPVLRGWPGLSAAGGWPRL